MCVFGANFGFARYQLRLHNLFGGGGRVGAHSPPLRPHSLVKASLVFVLKVGHRARRASKQNQSRTPPGSCDPSGLGFGSVSWVLSRGGVRLMPVFLVFPEHVCSQMLPNPSSVFCFFSMTSPGFLQECWGKMPFCHLYVIAEGRNHLVQDTGETRVS